MRHSLSEAAAFLRRPPASLPLPLPPPRGEGRPVLVLPVIGRGDRHTAPMRDALERLGFRPYGWELGVNPGPTPRILRGLARRLTALHECCGPLDVVGFSLGGVFARLLAHDHPDMVRQVVTVCSPFREIVDSAVVPLRPLLRAWQTPDLPVLAARVAAPLPVPGTFLYSPRDGIVSWRSCIEPDQPENCFAICGPHVTITVDPEVLAILSRRLVRPLG